MSRFLTPLIVKHLDGRNWEVMEEFEYYVGSLGSDEIIEVKKGFITDFASIPRAFWFIIGSPAGGKYGKAAVIHDWLYRNGIGTKRRADSIFLEAMEVLGVSRWRRYIMYLAVSLFGWSSWKGK